MDEALYDEFGNYIGPELTDEDDESQDEEDLEGDDDEDDSGADMEAAEAAADARLAAGDAEPPSVQQQIVLHEDKKYYPSAEEVYGEGVETLVMDEDAQPLEVPIIAAPKDHKFEVLERDALTANYPLDFMVNLMNTPELVRNIAVVGHLHHGKTTLLDNLVNQTHQTHHQVRQNERQMRYTDTRLDEQVREISVKTAPISLVLENSKGKSYLFNLLDTPGHVNFSDEVTAALQLADGVLLCVDAVEGLMLGTEHVIRQAVLQNVAITLCITKIDRLITELKLPPADAYFKLRHLIEEVNVQITTLKGDSSQLLDPIKGNVAFSSGVYSFSFTLESYAQLYCDVSSAVFDPRDFAARLWGDIYFQPDSRLFSKRAPEAGGERTFVQFILEPMYKIFSTVLGEDSKVIESMLGEFGVFLKPAVYGMDVKPLLQEVCSSIFGHATGLTEMMVRHVPSSKRAASTKVERLYTGPEDSELMQHCKLCNQKGPVVIYIAKLFPKPDCSKFDAFGRILSGSVKPGDRVRILGEAFTPDDEEDSAVAEVSAVWIYQARYRIPVPRAYAGSLVLLEGIDGTIAKTATVVPEHWSEELYIFRPLQFTTASVVKIATEPLNPSELPKMVEGLRKINKSYPLAITRVEESGEHTILGTGEMYLDSLMKDLRELYADIEVKVADPVVSFCETVVETSSLKCFAETPNKRNKLTMMAEPLEKGLGEDIEAGNIKLSWPRKQVRSFFEGKYGWDVLAVRSVWAFGPDSQGPNILLDDTLSGTLAFTSADDQYTPQRPHFQAAIHLAGSIAITREQDKSMLNAVRESIVQGFQWGVKEGPLCDEPIRNVKFKILDATIAPEPLHRGGGQIIPTARRVLYSAFLLATPRLMEPVYYVEIMTPPDCVSAIYTVLQKRRGHVTADVAKPGTPIFILKALVPVVESFGFETDIRYHTLGQAFCLSVFDHWQIVPGDPLDKSIILRPLEPAPTNSLAREFMVKTRRRKGMSEDVSINKFFDDPMLLELARQDVDLQAMLA